MGETGCKDTTFFSYFQNFARKCSLTAKSCSNRINFPRLSNFLPQKLLKSHQFISFEQFFFPFSCSVQNKLLPLHSK